MARRSDHSRDELYEMALDAAASIVGRDGLKGLARFTISSKIWTTWPSI